MAPCPFVLLDVHVHESPLACLPQPGRQRPPRLVCSCRGRGCGWQAALQVRSRDRPCTCKTDLRGRGIVLRGILRWCHSTLGSSVCVSTHSGWRSGLLCRTSRMFRRPCRQPCRCCRLEPWQPQSEQAPRAGEVRQLAGNALRKPGRRAARAALRGCRNEKEMCSLLVSHHS